MNNSNSARGWAHGRHRAGPARWLAALAAALTVAGVPTSLAAEEAQLSDPQQRPPVEAADESADTRALRPRLPTGYEPRRLLRPRRAMVIVVEENSGQHYSVSWSGLAESVAEFEYGRLLPSPVRSTLLPVVNATVQVAGALGLPAAALGDEITRSLVRQVSVMLGRQAGAAAAAAGLPAGGCAREMFSVLANRGIRSGENPFKAFVNVYGEAAMSDCLKAMAEPYYDTVVVLTDSQASFDTFSSTLLNLHRNNHVIDILINVHGCGSASGANSSFNNTACANPRLVFRGGAASPQDLLSIRASNGGRPLNINAVYQVSCWGSEFNEAWEDIGATAANGARELNYYVLLSPFVFMDRFTRGNRTLRDAAQDAYNAERSLVGGRAFTARLDIKPFLDRTFPPPGFGVDLIGAACPGNSRDGCNWSFTPLYNSAVNYTLSQLYGHEKDRPVNHSASSARIHRGPSDLRRAGT
jgi:hypothetical protein